MPFIIDGYNLLRAIEKLSEGGKLTELRLCRFVSDYFRYIGEKGEMIFDGVGPKDKGIFENMPNVEVLFVGADTDADSVIETKIAENSAPKNLAVVSSDRRIRFAAKRRKAMPIKSDTFWVELAAFVQQNKKKKNRSEPLEKREGISESETQQWMKLFGFKK